MLNKNNSILLGIDIQEKLVAMLKERAEAAISNSLKIIKTAKILNIETFLTEQYPKGLGATILPIREFLGEKYSPIEKTSFSAIGYNEPCVENAALQKDNGNLLLQKIKQTGKKQIVLFGIEAHICVYQTALALKDLGYEVYIICDACFSRNPHESEIAFQNLKDNKIQIITLEMLLFLWLQSSKTPGFKEIQGLIK